ncbi:beta strand repeat-containing protein, partial [Dyella mobilis]
GTTQVVDTSGLTLGTVTTGNLTVSSGGALDLGEGTVTGTLTAAGNGAISQASGNGSGLTVTQAASFTQNANGADVLLGNANNLFSGAVSFNEAPSVQIGNLSLTNTYASTTAQTVSLPSSLSGSLTLDYSAAPLAISASSVGGTLSVTGTSIALNGNESSVGSQTYDGAVEFGAGATALSATGAGSNITFDDTVGSLQALSLSAKGAVTFDGLATLAGLTSTSGTFNAGGLNIGTGGLSVTTTSGAISQSQNGAFVVAGTSSFNAGGQAITLTDSGNQFTGVVTLTGGTTQISQGAATPLILGNLQTGALTATSQNALILGSGVIGGNLVATGGGQISQTGALSVSGTSTINAGNAAIALSNAGNVFSGTVSLTGGATQIADNAPLSFGSVNVGALIATSNGAITEGSGSNAGMIVNGTASFTQNDTSHGTGEDILLGNANNKFSGNETFAAGSGAGAQINNLTFVNGSTTPGAVILPTTVAGNLTLDYSAAPIAVTGTNVGGALAITGKGITLDGSETSVGAQTYDGAVTLGTNTTLQSTGNGAIELTQSVSGPHALVISTGGTASIGGATSLTGLSSTSSTFSANALNIGAGGLSVTTTGGSITQSGAFVVTGASAFNAGSNAITLTDPGNNFAGAVALTGGTTQISQGSALTLGALHTGALTVTSQGNLVLGSGAIGGDLAATSNGGAISQTGALSVSGNSSVNAGNAAINLANGGNVFGGSVSLVGGATQIADASALNLGSLNTGDLTASSNGSLNLGSGNVSGNLVATSNGGAIGQTDALSVAGTATLNAGNGAISLTNNGNAFTGTVTATGAGVSLNDAGDLTVASLTDNGNGAVSLNATGMLTTYGINAGSGDISLASNGSTLTTGGALSGGNVSLTGLNGITSQNSIAASGTLTMSSAQGGISSSGSISAGTLTGSSAGAVALNANNAIGALGTFSASGFSLTNGQSLTVAGPLTGGASTALTVTSGDLALDSAVSGTNTALSASGVITEGGNGSITASILGGSAGGAVTLNGTNQIGTLGNFSAASFNLVDGQALAVSGAVNGGSAASITSTGGGLTINGSVAGTTTTLNAAGAISENGGSIVAGSLSGSANGAATLNGHNQVGTLQGFAANGFNFTDGQSLTVNGTVNGNSTTTLTTTAGNININGALDGSTVALYSAGAIGEGGDGINANTLTGSSAGATNLTGINQIDTLGSFTANGFSLVNARTLAINGPVNGGSSLALTTSNGDMAINGTVSGSATSLNSAGTLSEGSAGSIAAGSLSGSAGGGTTLTGQNKVGTLGDFRSLLGFSFADAQSLTLSALNGSNYTVNAGTSPVSLAVTGDLFQTDHNWLYDGTGTWSATGSIGTATNPIYVLGLTTQYIGLLGDPPAYFYAVGPLGNILPIIGDGVNVPTSLVSSRAQNVNNHLDAYIDASVITANYRSFGIVAPGILLPTDQQKCEAQGNSDCSDE